MFGVTASLRAPPIETRPSSLVVCELTVREVAPWARKESMTEAGMVTSAASASWNVPPATVLAGGAGDSDSVTGKAAEPKPETLQVNSPPFPPLPPSPPPPSPPPPPPPDTSIPANEMLTEGAAPEVVTTTPGGP